jgi:ribosomal protein S18 acetylase RimI-like enzyme
VIGFSAIQISKAGVNDLGAVKSCAEISYSIYIKRIGRKPPPMVADFKSQIVDGIVYVAKSQGSQSQVMGFVVCYPKVNSYFIENIAVNPCHQGKGIGKSLIAFCEAEALKLGLAFVELYTNERMVENLVFYPKIGFIETERRIEDGFHRVYFKKVL